MSISELSAGCHCLALRRILLHEQTCRRFPLRSFAPSGRSSPLGPTKRYRCGTQRNRHRSSYLQYLGAVTFYLFAIVRTVERKAFGGRGRARRFNVGGGEPRRGPRMLTLGRRCLGDARRHCRQRF